MASTLARIEVRMPQELRRQIQTLAKERGVSQSEIGLAAIQEFFERSASPETALRDAVAHLEARVAHQQAFLEGFVRVFLTVTPDPKTRPEAEQRQAAKRGAERFAQFQTMLAMLKETT
jgi:predicted transcriptional regulator